MNTKPKAPNRHQTARYRGAQIEKTFRDEYKVISDGWKYFHTFREALAYIDRKRNGAKPNQTLISVLTS